MLINDSGEKLSLAVKTQAELVKLVERKQKFQELPLLMLVMLIINKLFIKVYFFVINVSTNQLRV